MPKDYSDLSKEELLKLVEKQEAELKSKKYGLVWDAEREPEQVVLDCESNLPVLKRVKGKEIRTCDEDDNILIEGDNYHALTVLNYTHKEKIDVIYIDPPYNTKQDGFVYNDKRVDINDGYRHSKWLNFMEKRLNIARNVLKETGVVFISINEEELCQLKLLCDKIFGEENYFTIFTIKVRHEDRILKGDKDFHEVVEYLLMYRKSSKYRVAKRIRDNRSIDEYVYEIEELLKNPKKIQMGTKIVEEFEVGQFRIKKMMPSGNLFKKINIRGSIKEGNSSGRFYIANLEKLDNKMGFLYKVPNMGNDGHGFRYFLKPTSEKKVNGDYFQGVPLDKKDTKEIPHPNYFDFESEFNNVGYEGGVEFRNGKKPIDFLIKIFEIAGVLNNENSVILDFFAGSGSTGEALLELNRLSPGKRKFILCTNNEENICEKITYLRIKNAINGYKKVVGTGGNLKYFRTALIKKAKNKDQVRIDLTQKCTEMLCVKENIFNLEKETEDYKIFTSNKKDRFLCVYYNFLEDSFDDFLKEMQELKGKKIIYIFSMDGKVDKGLFSEIDDFEIEEIPQKIIDIYKQLVKMNIPVNADLIFSDFEKAKERIFTNKEKDDGARILRIVIEKVIQKIAQNNGLNILKNNTKEEKIAILNDKLKVEKLFSKVEWEENKTYIAIGNHAAHGEYSEYDLKNVENFYKHIQKLIDRHNIQ